MTSRTVPPLKLLRSPLIFVLAQVKISPVVAIEEKIPSLQESLRKRGYPRFAVRELRPAMQGPDGQIQQMPAQKQWEFIDKESYSSVLVDSDGISYQVTKYDSFETFMSAMREALCVFSQHVEPDLIQRVGLRYVDLVVPSEGKDIRAYFNDSLRGFKIHSDENREAFFSESVCQTGQTSKFIHRYVEASHGLGFPPDLLPTNLHFNRDPRMKSSFGLLDMDHYIALDENFEIQSAINHFFNLHDHQTKAFEASVTTDAIEEWKQP